MHAAAGSDITTTLVAEFKRMIVDGGLQPGGRLPPERDLAKQFGVNRASIRQALKALEIIGVVRQRVGDGTYLAHDASSILSAPVDFLLLVDGITFGELFEARRIFEPELAARAASRHTAGEMGKLEAIVEEMRHHFEAGFLTGVAGCDQRFHLLIWQMAGNRMCLRMFAPLHRTMTNSFALTWSINDYRNAIGSHAGILDAIRRADSDAARLHMREHLDRSESILIGVTRERSGPTSAAESRPVA